jgi:hypothetical protein
VDVAGRVTALQPGTTAITATHAGIASAAWPLSVKAPEPEPAPAPKLLRLSVTANKNELEPREKLALRVSGRYSDGSRKALSSGVDWISSDTAVASVNAAGELETWRAGRTAVVARMGEVSSPPLELVVRQRLEKTAPEPARRLSEYAPSKVPVYADIAKTPDANGEQLRGKIAAYINRAKDYRVRGDYRAALNELASARSSDPGNAEVRAEIEQTRRACLAEKRLGRAGLEC